MSKKTSRSSFSWFITKTAIPIIDPLVSASFPRTKPST
jgi:hypothetical protein